MRVVMIGPHLDSPGGMQAVVRTWLAADALRAVDLRYLSSTRGGSVPAVLAEGLRCETALLGDLVRRGAADLYHIHVAAGTSFWRKLAFFQQLHATGRPVVAHVHGSRIESFHDQNPLNAAAIRWMFARASRVFALHPAFLQTAERWTAGRARLRLLTNPVVLADFARPPELSWPDEPTVLFMGVVGDRKGAWDLAHAIPSVLKAVPTARFRFGGNGETDRLRALVGELGVADRVDVLGWLSGEAKLAAFRQATVYCLPSYNECLPVSVIEAMAASLPVVSTTVAGIPDLVAEGRTGFLIAPGDRQALADRLIRLLRDPAAARAMGEAGLATARVRFDHEAVVRRLIALWEEAIERPAG